MISWLGNKNTKTNVWNLQEWSQSDLFPPPQDIVAVLKFVYSKYNYFPKRVTVFPLCGSFPGRLSLREDCVGPGSSAFAGDTVWWLHQCWDGRSSESHEVVQLPHLTSHLQSLFPWDLSQFFKAGTTVKISAAFPSVISFSMPCLLLGLFFISVTFCI